MTRTTTEGRGSARERAPADPGSDPRPIFPGESEVAARCRTLDWAATPLGPVEAWTASLRTAAELVLAAAFPMVLLWGPALVQLYNDGYRALMGGKHPTGLGQPTRECWPEVWHINAPIYDRVWAGETVVLEDTLFPIARSGALEDAWFTLSYSPVRDDAGEVGGVLVTVFETTPQVKARDARELERERLLAAEREARAAAEEAAAALRASEAQYRTLFTSLDEGFLLAEVLVGEAGQPVDLLYLEANPAATRMTRTDYTGRRLREIDPDYEPYWLEIWGRVARTGVGERHERYTAPLDAWFDFYVFRVGDAEGRRVAVVFRDVTARKRRQAHADFLASIQDDFSRLASADEILQVVGAKLGAYLQLATCSFIDVDESAAEQLVVSHTWTITGLPSLLGRFRIEDYLQPEFARACRAGETIVVRDTHTDPRTDGERYARYGIGAFVVVPLHRDGAWKFHLGVSNTGPRDWRDDEVALIEEVANRLFPRLERGRAEAALRASEARLRLALEVAELGTWSFSLTDGSGTLDERAARIVGLPAGDFADVAQAQAVGTHPDDLAPMQAAVAAGVASGEPFELRYRVIHPDGSIHHVASRAVALTDDVGRPARLVGTNRDVTAEREAEAERARLLAAAESARAEAEAANRAKSEFLAVMSHELRTPLNAIGGYAELMEMGIRGPVTAQQREDLRRLQASQRHLLGLINEVLNYAKLETGAVHYDVATVRVRDALAGAEALVTPQVEAKGLTLAVTECPPDLAVRADAEKLRQILVNLLSNAVKFTDRGGRIELAGAASGDRVVVHVRDTGIGIAADQLERIFDPFVQVRSDLTRTAEGTGLGLAISRDLARGMGGDLVAASTPGVGSVFTLALPRT